MSNQRTVYVIDHDVATRRSLCALTNAVETDAWPFANGTELLKMIGHLEPACILLDMDLLFPSGLEIMNELLWRGLEWPVIAISTGVELSVAIEAMKLGAIDFLVKPIERIPLTKALTLGWSALDRMIEANENRRLAQERVARLTAREIGISSALLSGQPNKAVAFQLGISVRTVEMHRAHIMAKLGVKNLAEAALIVAQAGFDERPATVRQDRRQQLKPPETVPGGLKGPFFPPGAGPHPAAALTSMRRKDDSAGRRAPARK